MVVAVIIESDLSYDLNALVNDTIHEKYRYAGIGPSLGIAASIPLINHFSINSSIATALLIGSSNSYHVEKIDEFSSITLTEITIDPAQDLTFDATSISPITATNSSTRNVNNRFPHQKRVVPNFDAKIALAYNNQPCGPIVHQLSIEAGYKVSYYFNPFEYAYGNNNGNFDTEKSANLSFSGPFLGVEIAL